MSLRLIIRKGLVCAGALALGACASTNDIDPEDLPPEAKVDDGVDYYSADLGTDDLFAYGDNQWAEDEDGNRVYLLNRVRRGQSASYYVGDIRYLYANNNAEGLRGTGYGNTPVYVSRGGAPLQSPTYRGGRDDTYYQTRRGRIIYLPNTNSSGSASNPAGPPPGTSGSSGMQPSSPASGSAPPRPSAAPPRPATRAAPPQSRPQPRTRPADRVRRPDR